VSKTPSSEKWFQAVVDADFAEMESRPCGGGAGAIVWMLGVLSLFIVILGAFLILNLSSVKAADSAWYRNHQTGPATPLAKDGQCPGGYMSGPSSCNPWRNAPRCVPKQGQCPSGWPQSGAFCCEQTR
jgi:hypothetical protein